MIDRDHDLPLTRQADLLKLSRSGLYYQPRPVPPADLAVMRRIDELHLNRHPPDDRPSDASLLPDDGICKNEPSPGMPGCSNRR
jgi:hypothetical protein